MNEVSNKNAMINIRARAEQRDLIDRASRIAGRNRSDFMLEAACRQANEIIADQNLIEMNEQDYVRFVAALDAPVKPNPALERLLKSSAPWDKV